jgi:hypothetical protein
MRCRALENGLKQKRPSEFPAAVFVLTKQLKNFCADTRDLAHGLRNLRKHTQGQVSPLGIASRAGSRINLHQ